MCGIIGAANFRNTSLSHAENDFSDRMDRMNYRGPDAQDLWTHPKAPVTLGHLRLSILDLSTDGTQPMHLETASGLYSMVFNGEVYNYREIREELITLGYTFKTTTDSEVILAAFAAWGQDAVHRFNGMFAIAFYNDKKRELTLVRDRLGIKPLYYRMTENGVVFASEVKAMRDLGTPPPLNVPLIHQYMEHGYISGENTLDQGIKRLMPGHLMTINEIERKTHRYWSIKRPSIGDTPKLSFEQAVEKGKNLLADSLKLRLRADVPVGVFLSGGLDSSAVVAMLSKQLEQPIKTFSVRYDIGEYGEEYDESVYAEQVAKQFGTEHHSYTMTAEDFERYIPEFVRTMDEPVTEAAALSLHFVSELAKDHVKVVLSGEGSDEIFAGYDLYQYMNTLERLRKVATPLGAKFAAKIARKFMPAGNKIRKYTELAAKPFEERYQGISVYDNSYHKRLYNVRFERMWEPNHFGQSLMDETQGQDLVSRMLEYDTRTWLVDDLLIKADRMSMGSSLELRVPFLDYRMVEFAASLPTEYKIHKGEGKYILKKMMEGELPDNIIYREKRGFPTPLARMFQGPLKNYVTKTLMPENAKPLISDLFNTDEIIRLCNEHWEEKQDHHRILWQLLVLEEWLKQNHNNGVYA